METAHTRRQIKTDTPVRFGELLTTPEAAVYLRISLSTMYKLVWQRKIPCYKPNGKHLYFLLADLQEWVRSRRLATQAELDQEANRLLNKFARRRP